MNYYRGMAFIALIHTALAHTMDQTPSALTLPNEMWEKITAISSCKNIIRLICKYLAPIASLANKDKILGHTPLYLHPMNKSRFVLEYVRSDKPQLVETMITYWSHLLYEKDILERDLLSIAQSDTMRSLLKKLGIKTAHTKRTTTALEQAAYAGDNERLQKELKNYTQDDNLAATVNAAHYPPMCLAAVTGQYECIETLINARFQTNQDSKNGTPLVLAAVGGYTSCVELLLENGADPNKKNAPSSSDNTAHDTPLIVAACLGHMAIVELLLENEANPLARDKRNHTALDHAYQNKHKEIVDLLKKHTPAGTDGQMYLRHAQLYNACAEGRKEEVLTLLTQVKDIDTSLLPHFHSLLHVAAQHGQCGVIRLLLEKEMAINALATPKKLTPLMVAIFHNQLEAVQLLCERGADIKTQSSDGGTLLNGAAYQGNCAMIQYLVSKGEKLNEIGFRNQTLLHIAVYCQHVPLIDFLLEQDVMREASIIEHRNDAGRTALDQACIVGNDTIVKKLLAAGANINGDPGATPPLIWATLNGHTTLAKTLHEKGANIHATTSYGTTSLIAAVTDKNSELVTYYLSNGVSVNKLDRTGSSALYWACTTANIEIVRLLLDANAQVTDAMIKEAQSTGQVAIKRLLREKQYKQTRQKS